MPISDQNYNDARHLLLSAGSNTAKASHVKHSKKNSSPDGHGKDLLIEAIREFRQQDAQNQALTRGMSMMHFVAVSNAATIMELDVEYIFSKMPELEQNFYAKPL